MKSLKIRTVKGINEKGRGVFGAFSLDRELSYNMVYASQDPVKGIQ